MLGRKSPIPRFADHTGIVGPLTGGNVAHEGGPGVGLLTVDLPRVTHPLATPPDHHHPLVQHSTAPTPSLLLHLLDHGPAVGGGVELLHGHQLHLVAVPASHHVDTPIVTHHRWLDSRHQHVRQSGPLMSPSENI